MLSKNTDMQGKRSKRTTQITSKSAQWTWLVSLGHLPNTETYQKERLVYTNIGSHMRNTRSNEDCVSRPAFNIAIMLFHSWQHLPNESPSYALFVLQKPLPRQVSMDDTDKTTGYTVVAILYMRCCSKLTQKLLGFSTSAAIWIMVANIRQKMHATRKT